MRTTLDIDDDVLAAIEEAARIQQVSTGQVVSKLLREAMIGRPMSESLRTAPTRISGGFRPFAATGNLVTNHQIDRIRDDEAI